MTGSTRPGPPAWRKLIAEVPAGARFLAAHFRQPSIKCERRRRTPVIVIPGFLGRDILTRPLRRTLEACGYRVRGWGQGFNVGARGKKLAGLLSAIDSLAAEAGEKVALVGWSMGGLYAREAAKRRPDQVCAAVTLGTPFSQGSRDQQGWELYDRLWAFHPDQPTRPVRPAEKPPVRTVAIWSENDGIIASDKARGRPGEADEQVQVHCRHTEMVSHPEALNAVLAALERCPL